MLLCVGSNISSYWICEWSHIHNWRRLPKAVGKGCWWEGASMKWWASFQSRGYRKMDQGWYWWWDCKKKSFHCCLLCHDFRRYHLSCWCLSFVAQSQRSSRPYIVFSLWSLGFLCEWVDLKLRCFYTGPSFSAWDNIICLLVCFWIESYQTFPPTIPLPVSPYVQVQSIYRVYIVYVITYAPTLQINV